MCQAECTEKSKTLPPLLTNRMTFLSILESAMSDDRSNDPFGVAAMVPEPPSFPDYDSVVDDACYTVDDGVIKKFTTLTYEKRKDDAIQGKNGLQCLQTWLNRPRDKIMRLRGGKDSLGFLFLYELMTNRAKLKILPNDDPYNWGCVLLRMMPPMDWADKWRKNKSGQMVPDSTNSRGNGGNGDVLLSILRCMANNPVIVKDKSFPLYEDNRKFKFSKMFRSNNVLQTLLKSLKEVFGKRKNEIKWPALQAVGKGQSRGGSKDGFNHYEPPTMIR
jgi:hypothetical protein